MSTIVALANHNWEPVSSVINIGQSKLQICTVVLHWLIIIGDMSILLNIHQSQLMIHLFCDKHQQIKIDLPI